MTINLLDKISSDQLIADFEELGSAIKIGKKYGISKGPVYRAFKEINYDCSARKNVAALITKEYLQEAYERLGTLNAIAKELGVYHDSIKLYMDKFGLEYDKQILYQCDHDFFSRDTEESAYIAGFCAADACIKTVDGHECLLSIGLSKKDKLFLEKIRSILKAEISIKDYPIISSKINPNWNDGYSSSLNITSRKLCADIKRFNVVPRKTLILTFPQWLINHPLCHHFIRGYFDGDGSIGSYKSTSKGKEHWAPQMRCNFAGTNAFLTDIRAILSQNCGTKIDKKMQTVGKINILEYGGNGALKNIINYLYKDATIYLDRKYDIAKQLII